MAPSHRDQTPRESPYTYNLFIKDYCRSVKARNLRTRVYRAMARPAQSRFLTTFLEYKRKKLLVKRPGNAFTYFVKNFWKNQGRARANKPVLDIGKLVGTIWMGMTSAERMPYQVQAARAKAIHDRKLADSKEERAQLNEFLGVGHGQAESDEDKEHETPPFTSEEEQDGASQ